MNILGIVLVCFLIFGLFLSVVMMRSSGDTDTDIPSGIGTIDDPKV